MHLFIRSLARVLLITAAALASQFAAAQNALSVRNTCPVQDGLETEAFLLSAPKTPYFHLKVAFIGKEPTNKQIDRMLRGCLQEAVMRDGSKDIIVTAWHRSRRGASEDEDRMLYPYPGPVVLFWDKKTRSASVRERDAVVNNKKPGSP
jgi:hypothetical protein